MCLPSTPASAAPTKLKSWITDGYVTTSALSGNTVYLGGQFNYVGPPNQGFAAFDQTTREADTTFPSANGDVYVIVSDKAGGWYIGGHFTAVSGVARANLAHIRADHSLDPNWNPDARNGSNISDISAIAVSGNTVYVSGDFATIGGQARTSLAAIDATTGAATAWSPQIVGGVRTIAVNETTVYIGGGFSSVDGQPRSNLAAFDANTGVLTSWNSDASNSVTALVANADILYVSGYFTSIGGQQRSYIAAIDAVTGIPTNWNPQIQGHRVYTLALHESTLYIGGDFSKVNNLPRNNLAALDVTTGSVAGWNPDVMYSASLILAIAVSGASVYVGGVITTLEDKKKPLVAINTDTGTLVDWDVLALRPNESFDSLLSAGAVDALAVNDSQVYVGGEFASIGGVTRNNVAALDATTGVVTSWDPDANHTVYSLIVSGTNIYAGGDFTIIGGLTRNHLAALDAITAVPTAWDPNSNGVVRSLLGADNIIYAGGGFTTVGGQLRNGLVAVDAATGTVTDWNPNAEGGSPNLVTTIAKHEDTVYVGGSFTSIGGQPRNHLAALDATTGSVTNWKPDVNNAVMALTIHENTIYAGGAFTTTNGLQRDHLAAFDIHSGSVNDWNPHANDSVYALAASATMVYAGGPFTSVNGQEHNYFAELDATSGTPTNWNPDLNSDKSKGSYGFVATLIVDEPVIYVGGGFRTAGAQFEPSFVLFKDSALPTTLVPPSILSQPRSQTITPGQTAMLTVNVSGTAPLSYQWYRGESGDTRAPIAGATNSTYATPPLSQTTSYWVRITNAAGSTDSATTTVNVAAEPARTVFVYLPTVRR